MRTIKLQCPKTGKLVEYPADKVVVVEGQGKATDSSNYAYIAVCSAQEFLGTGRHVKRQPR